MPRRKPDDTVSPLRRERLRVLTYVLISFRKEVDTGSPRLKDPSLDRFTVATSYKAHNRALSTKIAQARALDQYAREHSRNDSPATNGNTSNREDRPTKPARCSVCIRNGEKGKHCQGRGGRDEKCPLYEQDSDAGQSDADLVAWTETYIARC